jgi:hypothetical protein
MVLNYFQGSVQDAAVFRAGSQPPVQVEGNQEPRRRVVQSRPPADAVFCVHKVCQEHVIPATPPDAFHASAHPPLLHRFLQAVLINVFKWKKKRVTDLVLPFTMTGYLSSACCSSTDVVEMISWHLFNDGAQI